MKVLEEKPGNTQTLLYLACVKFQQKKNQDVIAILQKIVNSSYQSDSGDAYEMACLIYADYLMSDRKLDQAESLLKNCYLYNKNNGTGLN